MNRLLKVLFNVQGKHYKAYVKTGLQSGPIWKDGNRLGTRKEQKIREKYREILTKRLSDILLNPEDNLYTLEELEELSNQNKED